MSSFWICWDLVCQTSRISPIRPNDWCKFFEQFLDSLNIHQATLVGNSLGAGLAMAMALTHPDRVQALILISGLPADIRKSVELPRYQQFLDRRPPLWLAKLGNWLAGRWASRSLLEEIVYDDN